MEDLEGSVLDQAIEKVKFFFRFSILSEVLSISFLTFFFRLAVLNLLVRLGFALIICKLLSDEAKETVIDLMLIKDRFVKLALMPYLVLSDTVLVHVLEQIGIVDSAPSQCQFVDVGKSK